EKTVSVRKNGSVYRESYDKLILSPGAEPIRPALPGFDGKRVFSVRGIPDALAIREFCERNS
ncbi:MAG TPA: CoA-disulfide reductase, partial [Ruminococcaceae bacterium]|nr:CoA-disulfide reductase [Oscillospiraceae bacterium]